MTVNVIHEDYARDKCDKWNSWANNREACDLFFTPLYHHDLCAGVML